jgi:hypothetical protein
MHVKYVLISHCHKNRLASRPDIIRRIKLARTFRKSALKIVCRPPRNTEIKNGPSSSLLFFHSDCKQKSEWESAFRGSFAN